jgi:hypothetical protein
MFWGRFGVSKGIGGLLVKNFAGIFSSNKSVPANIGRKLQTRQQSFKKSRD